MTLVHFDPLLDIESLHAARAALVNVKDWDSAYDVDALLERMREARRAELMAAVAEELTERRGRLRVV